MTLPDDDEADPASVNRNHPLTGPAIDNLQRDQVLKTAIAEQYFEDLRRKRIIKTGIEGLDELFYGGGIVAYNAVLLEGPPGSGKTTLGIQYIYNGALKYDEPGIIVSFEETAHQLLRDTRMFGWDLDKLQRENKVRILCTTPEILFKSLEPNEMLDRTIREIRPTRILIDSLVHITQDAPTPGKARELVFKLITILKRHRLTAVLINEIQALDSPVISPEAYLVDTVMVLTIHRPASTDQAVHYLEVRKSRGQFHRPGPHSYKFTPEGIQLYPQPQILGFTLAEPDGTRRASGIPALDRLIQGGFLSGTTNLVIGTPGTGKTLMGVHFAYGGCRNGDICLMVSLREPVLELMTFTRSFGMDMASLADSKKLYMWYYPPIAFNFDEMMFQLERLVQETAIQRLIFDGLNEIGGRLADPGLFAIRLAMLKDFCYRYGITALLLYDAPTITGTREDLQMTFTAHVDTTILLQMIETESTIRKVLTVLKMKGSDHVKDLIEYDISPSGIVITRKMTGLSGILTGTPQGLRKQTIEEALQPLSFIEGFAEIVGQDLPNPRQAEIMKTMATEARKVAAWLKNQFGWE